MNGRNLSQRIRAAGYRLALSDDWQKVRVSGASELPASLRDQVRTGRDDILFWLRAEALADGLSGSILHQGEIDVPPGYWRFYPVDRINHPEFSRQVSCSPQKNQTKQRK